MHEYTECYLYYSTKEQETCENIKKIWKEHFEMELAHLKLALSYLRKNTDKDIKDLFKNPNFPELLIFGENKDYIRNVIESTVYNTAHYEDYINNKELEDCERFCFYQDIVNKSDDTPIDDSPMESWHGILKKETLYNNITLHSTGRRMDSLLQYDKTKKQEPLTIPVFELF